MHLNYIPVFYYRSEAAWWFWVWRGGEKWWYHCGCTSPGFVVGSMLNAGLLACRWGLTKTCLLVAEGWQRLACLSLRADKDHVVVGRVLNADLLACCWGLTKTVLLLGGCWMLTCLLVAEGWQRPCCCCSTRHPLLGSSTTSLERRQEDQGGEGQGKPVTLWLITSSSRTWFSAC